MKHVPVSTLRRFMLWFFDGPSNDPYVSITMDVELTAALRFLDAFTREHGERVGLQHLVTAAVARTLRELPALNVKIFDRKIYQLERVGVAVPVHLPSGERAAGADETGLIIVHDADRKSLAQIARETRHAAGAEREGALRFEGSAAFRRAARHAPRALLHAALALGSAVLQSPLAYHLLEPRVGVSTVVTNVGSVLPLPPGARFRAASVTIPARLGHLASVFALAPASDEALARDGQVVVRRVLPITAVVDHRAIDGVLMGRLGECLARMLTAPEALARLA